MTDTPTPEEAFGEVLNQLEDFYENMPDNVLKPGFSPEEPAVKEDVQVRLAVDTAALTQSIAVQVGEQVVTLEQLVQERFSDYAYTLGANLHGVIKAVGVELVPGAGVVPFYDLVPMHLDLAKSIEDMQAAYQELNIQFAKMVTDVQEILILANQYYPGKINESWSIRELILAIIMGTITRD